MKHLLIAALAMCMCITTYAKGKEENKETEKQTIYMFGVGAAFGDTTVCFTIEAERSP